MQKRKYIILKFILMNLLIVILISGLLGKEAKAETRSNVSDIIDLTGIMRDSSGDSIIDSNYVTREEFAQILVQASPCAGEVKSTNKLKLFKDVQKNSNKGAYIQIAVTKGYMSGYLGGVFQPTKAVTLKEAVYATLGILGYTKEDFTGKLSDARYDTFKELGLGKNISLGENDKLTKTDCVTLFYNLLNAKHKTGAIYGTVLGYSLNEENEIDYQSLLNKKTKGPVVTEKGWESNLNSKLSSYTIIRNDKKIAADKIEDNSIVYYAEQAKKIWVYDKKVYGMLESITYGQDEPQDLTVAGTAYTVEKPENMKKIMKAADITKGSMVVLLLGRDDKAAYILPIKSDIADTNWEKELSFDIEKATIYKNDTKTTLAEIHSYDVIYYSEMLKTVWAFDKKVYGTLDSITLTQGEPQELTISGISYTVEATKIMKKKFKEESIQTGTPVVLMLGWEDKVSKVLKLSSVVAEGSWLLQLSFDISQAAIYKEGVRITAADINSSDVIYFSKELQTLWVYGNKAYGVLDTISPSLSAPDSVAVAGKTYSLKSLPLNSSVESSANTDNLTGNAWGVRLRENGIKEGVNVVVLFGYNGLVVDIRTVDKMPVTITGYVLSLDSKVVNENKSSEVKQVIRMVDTEGIIREFPCSDLNISKGMVVEVDFKFSNPVITKLNTPSNVPSDIATRKLAQNARIIEVKDSNYSKLTSSELMESVWSMGNIIYYKLNSANEITDLIVTNVTDSFYQFAVLKKIVFPSADSYSSYVQITLGIGKSETTMAIDTIKWNINPGPKAIQIVDNELKDMQNLNEVRIAYISGKQANTSEAVYRIADDVLVYFYKNGEYYAGSLEDISNFEGRHVNGYMKQLPGPIRVIIVTD